MTLRGDKQTTHRRVSAIPQLKCISPKSICALHKIDVLRCTNQGSAYGAEDVQWSCTASLPQELKLGSTDVICEGYASSNDPYVLKGSCGVEYRLILNDAGEKKYPHLAGSTGNGARSDWNFFGVALAVVAVVAFVIWYFASDSDRNRPEPPNVRRGGDGGGGGGGGGWWPGGGNDPHDPPPPYPGSKPSSSSSSAAGNTWQPGFWTGLAGGAATGYWAGRNRNTGSGYNYDRPAYRGGRDWDAGPSNWRPNSGSGSSSSASSSAQHESTGFGSTSRR